MILALYRTLLVRHFSLSGYWCFLIQLHVLAILPLGGWTIFFVVPIVFHVGHAAVAIKKIEKTPYLDTYAVKDLFEFAEEI